jgi:ABC-type nitrate/sulfonate/bicarbonate transport system substrate-binding protein
MFVLVAAAAVAAGCSSSGGSNAGTSGPSDSATAGQSSASAAATGGADSGGSFTTETLGTVSNLMHTDEYVAAQEGFYAENGLDVKIKIFASGSDVTKALKAGTIKYGSASTTAVPPARAAGVPLKLLVGGMNDASSALYDGPLGIIGRTDRGITDQASSLKGKKIGVLTGSTTEQYLRLYLEKNGMTEKDVTLVNLQVPDHPVSLQQGDVDAVVSWEPYVTQEVRGLGSKAVTVSRGEGLLGYVIGLGVLDPTLQSSKAELVKFVSAVAEANAFIRKNPQKAAEDAANYLPGVDVSAAADAIQNHLKWDPRLSACTQKAMKNGAAELFKSGKVTQDFSVSDLMDTSIIAEVEKAHPEWFADLPPAPTSC